MPRMIICPNCGEYKEHRSSGLCYECYTKLQNKRYYQKHKKHIRRSSSEYQLKLRQERISAICEHSSLPFQCMQESCTISNPILLSVRHINGRLPEGEHTTKKYHIRSCRRQVPRNIQNVREIIFQEHLKNNNYLVFCVNHGRVYERGTIAERIRKGNQQTKHRIKRQIHRLYLLGGKCAICGEKDYNFLLAHHKEGFAGPDKALTNMGNKRFQELYSANLLQCLCFNCHILHHYREKKENVNLLDYCIT